jgi:GntR family transcriptional regulator
VGGSEWVHGSAPYVRAREPGERDAWSEETAAAGRSGTQRVVHAHEIPAPAEVLGLLGLIAGSEVVERRRVIFLDGTPTELTNTYYPVAIARGTPLSATARIPGGAVTLLARMGYSGYRVTEEVSARLPSPVERESLNLSALDPVLCLTRVTLDSGDRPFQLDLSVFPATTQRLRYEMRIG